MGVAMCGCSGSGSGAILSANLTVENHGEDHAENQQEGDSKGDAQHHSQVALYQTDEFGAAGRGEDGGGLADTCS